ncbi:MAG: hypothetical protein JJ896_00150 [Rhodothermales bacterium]|nr:hypothetical protein [Rhodothermales bacterium]MBO6778037.1 hypothetical protein [Rhodothermales bacterium]
MRVFFVLLILLGSAPYPIDGYEYSGIRRLERLRLIAAGEMPGTPPPPGARKAWGDIELHRVGDAVGELPPPDPELQRQITALFAGLDPSYGLALLDVTPGREPRLAVNKAAAPYQPGSVGKLAIMAGLFAELERIYPTDYEARRRVLRDRSLSGDFWVIPNSHAVPIFNLETRAYQSRAVVPTDEFTLFEWVDHAISASSNAAASVIWKEAMLMRAFGADYPPSPTDEAAFWKDTSAAEKTAMAVSVVNDPLRTAGISEEEWRLGTMFTSGARRVVPGTRSTGSAIGLMKFLLRIEEGTMVDEWSSLEMKRLMYQTQRRIRYASAPGLSSAAVYFKSGSLYRCQSEEGYSCGKYLGNVNNYMNSVATVETTDGRVYLVALMSNVLRKNSAADHQALAERIERIMARPAQQG